MRRPAGVHAGPWEDLRREAAAGGQRQLRERLKRLRRRTTFLSMAATWLVFLMIAMAVVFQAVVPTTWLWIPIGLSLAMKGFWHVAHRCWPGMRAKAPERALAAAQHEIGGRLQPLADAINADLRVRTQRQGRVSVRAIDALEFMGEVLRAAQGFPFALRSRSLQAASPAVAGFARDCATDAVIVAALVTVVGVAVPLLTGSLTIALFAAMAADLLSAVWLAERRLSAVAELAEWGIDDTANP